MRRVFLLAAVFALISTVAFADTSLDANTQQNDEPDPFSARVSAPGAQKQAKPAGPRIVVDAKLLLASANAGDPAAQNQLAQLLLRGEVFRKDVRKAGIWFQRAANQGNDDAQYRLALMILKHEVPGDRSAAYLWLLLCARNGDPSRIALRDKVEEDVSEQIVKLMKSRAKIWQPVREHDHPYKADK